MADGIVRVGDKNIDNTELTVNATTVERQRVVLSGINATDLAPANSYEGLATYDAAALGILSNILVELKVQSMTLQVLIGNNSIEVDGVRDSYLRKLD